MPASVICRVHVAVREAAKALSIELWQDDSLGLKDHTATNAAVCAWDTWTTD